MTTYAGLLRGVNVGGNKSVPMAALRAMVEGMGFAAVRTLLQSGNVVFSGGSVPGEELEGRLEEGSKKTFGFDVACMVRTAEEVQRAVEANPFPEAARDDPGHLLVAFLKAAPGAGAVEALRVAIPGPESVELRGRELYITYPDGVGRSTLTDGLMNRHLAVSRTARNWNTVLKLAEMTRA